MPIMTVHKVSRIYRVSKVNLQKKRLALHAILAPPILQWKVKF